VPLFVAGPAAELVDAKDGARSRLPLAAAVVVIATAILLVALTGSVVVPVKAILMNLDLTTPLLLFVFVFGLSMDYEVFLLARIKEEWDRDGGGDRAANDRAVRAGIIATGPVVTAAAVSIGIVFLGFALGELVAVKEIGVAMVVAVFLDVTVVRGLLLPSVMSLLGRANWWRPRLRRRPVSGPASAVRPIRTAGPDADPLRPARPGSGRAPRR
jgi:RND superfamily putative drug exporter